MSWTTKPQTTRLKTMLRTVTVVLAATVVMAVTASGQDDDLAVAVEQTRQNVSELAETIRLQPENAQLWAHWFTQRTMLHHLEARLMGRELDAADATEAERQSKERLAAWFASWEEEFPANPALSLLRLQILEPVELQIPGLEALATRFPHHLPIAERLISAYTTRGERQRAIAAATEFLAHNPEQPQAYAMLHRHYLEMNDEENLDALIDAWLRHLPGDFDANVLWLQRQRPYLAPEEMPAVHRQITARLRGDERARWCAYLGQNDSSVAAAVDCFTVALPELDTEAPIFESSLTRYADALRRSGDESAFTQVFSRLPAERRVEIHQRMVQNLVRERHCAEAAALLAEVADPGRALAGTGAVLDRCLGDAAFRQRTVEAVAGAASQDVLGILGQATPDWPVEGLEAALEQRRATAEEHFRWLDVLYEKSGQDGKRLALLERWHQDFPAADSARTRELAELYLLADRPEDAVRVLEEHLSHSDGARAFTLAEDLTAIYHHLGRNDAASELAQRLFAGDDEERGYGALLLARLAFAAQKLEKARDFYEIFYRETSVNHWRQAEDFQVLLLELDDRDALVRHLERQWQARLEVHQGDGRDRDEWVGDKLLELGLAEKALDLYRRRIVGGSAPAALLQKTAELAEGLGEWDQALAIREELLERSPSDPRAWGQLAEHFLVRGEVERAFAVLDEAFDRLPRPDAKLWHLWVSAVLSVERGSTRIPAPQLLEAIEVLRQAVEVFDARVYDRGLLYARLTRLYHHLGLQASEELAAGNAETAEASSEAPGTSSRDVTGIPSGEDKAAAADLLARADELNSGVAGL